MTPAAVGTGNRQPTAPACSTNSSTEARLATDHHLIPGSPGSILLRTPYGRRSPAVLSWKSHGLDLIAQDVRGRHDSPGAWIPYSDHEYQDGLAALDSLRTIDHRRPIILAGSSYEGFTALEGERAALDAGHADRIIAVVVMVPALGLWETAHHADGTPRWRERIGWWHEHGFSRTPRCPLCADELTRRVAVGESEGPDALFADEDYGPGAHRAWMRLWSAPRTDLKRWARPGSAPVLVVTGAHCPLRSDAHRLVRELSAAGRSVTVLDGPWGHRLLADLPADGPVGAAIRARGGLRAPLLAWLNRRLVNDGQAPLSCPSSSPEHVFVGGEDGRATVVAPDGRAHVLPLSDYLDAAVRPVVPPREERSL
ncbi:CocE/NonD family hydrolase [Austwickia chelonae]|uniref:CocE/NonD family hydrolase n=1 Tax=Austwickia chelonae TaxID=100225 RepID=UPI0013C357BD|nr:CocE/NonD family hydrolase [Austwickia chelonae]